LGKRLTRNKEARKKEGTAPKALNSPSAGELE